MSNNISNDSGTSKPSPADAAKYLALLMEHQLNLGPGTIKPLPLRLFILAYWKRVSMFAHTIHEEMEDGTQKRQIERVIDDVPLRAIEPEVFEYIKDTQAIVYANSFEKLKLWEECEAKHTPWEQNNSGYLARVTAQTMLSLNAAFVDGRKILFVFPTSNIVDHAKIRTWLLKHLPDAKITEAINFFNVLR